MADTGTVIVITLTAAVPTTGAADADAESVLRAVTVDGFVSLGGVRCALLRAVECTEEAAFERADTSCPRVDPKPSRMRRSLPSQRGAFIE